MNPNVEFGTDATPLSGNTARDAHSDDVRAIDATADPAERGFARILIVRLGSMGDIIHSLPAVAFLRRAFPRAQIDWVVEERWAELLCSRAQLRVWPQCPQKPLVDTVHVVDTRAWRSALLARQTRGAIASVVRTLRGARYQAAIDLQSAFKSALVAKLSQAPLRFGFARPIELPARLFYTRRVAAAGEHIAEQNASLAEAAIAAAGRELPSGTKFEFPLPEDAQHDDWANNELARRGIADFALLNPGAGWGAKCWPANRFGEVSRALALVGIRPLVNYGPGEEALARSVVELSDGAADSIACSVGQLIALSRRARLCIGGDTGPVHLAAALGVPVVAIYGPTDPARNGPIGPGMSPSIHTTNIEVLRSDDSQTSHSRSAQPEAGLLKITAAEVIAAARRLLQHDPPQRPA
jgi:heptosyltransferase-1